MVELRNEIVEIINKVCISIVLETSDFAKPLSDVNIDSLDLSGILLAIEEKYKIRIPEEAIDGLDSINSIVEYVKDRMKAA